MFEKREIIYKKDNYDRRKGTFYSSIYGNILFFYIVIILYIINYCTAPTLQIHTTGNTKANFDSVKDLNHSIKYASDAGFEEYKNCNNIKEETLNPIYSLKHPFPFRYTPDDNTVYYFINELLGTCKFIYFEGMRNDYERYMAGNCFECQSHAELAAGATGKIWEGIHFLIDRHGYKKVKDNEDLIYSAIDEMIKSTCIIIDTEQLDLFPDIMPKERKQTKIIDYTESVYKRIQEGI